MITLLGADFSTDPYLPLVLSSTPTDTYDGTPSVFLHPLYLGMESKPTGGVYSILSIYSRRFDVPFCDAIQATHGRMLSWEELMRCYSVLTDIFGNRS